MTATILIVEDDFDIQYLLYTALKSYNYQPIAVSSGVKALEAFDTNEPDLVLLDVDLPDSNGFEICEKIREFSTIPIIFVSCLVDGSDVIHGLELGGDDYVTKPFDLKQLVARINSNLRRAPVFNKQLSHEDKKHVHNVDVVTIGALTFNYHLQRVSVNGKPIPLSNKEFLILSILAQHPEKIFSAHELYAIIWGDDSLGETRTLKVHISHLRKKLEDFTNETVYIQTVRGFGYQFKSGV